MDAVPKRIAVQDLRDFCLSLFQKLDFAEEYAKAVTEAMLEGHLRGAHNQGLGRLPIYVKRIELGLINAKPVHRVVRDSGAAAVLDGDHGMGHYAASKAMNMAIQKAEKHGIGAVGVMNSTHFGVAAYYGRLAVDREKIGMVFTNSTALMAALGGAERLIGNNPLSIAVPRPGHAPVLLDMACSNVSYSTIQRAVQEGSQIPSGWGTDKNGVETNDPAAVLDMGMLIPAGVHKGYGLAVMIDILAGVLTGSAFGKDVGHLYKDLKDKQRTGHFLMAIDIDHFIDRKSFFNRLETFIESIKSSPRAPGVEELLLPGERSDRRRQGTLQAGVALPGGIVQQLGELAEKFELKQLAP
ncbi:MAG: Ldh family oxidoreductase [Spirochaetaceae bacterium]|nr:MAG: Ldh family oxidoreductase [Spirochaetaceae bacterium]